MLINFRRLSGPLFALLVLASFAPRADAAIAVTLCGNASGSGDLVSSSCTTASGDAMVVGLAYDNGATFVSVTDSKSNSYTQAGTTLCDGSHCLRMYYSCNITGGASHTATGDFTGSTFGTIYLIRITGVATSCFDVTNQGLDAATPYTVATGTLAQAAEAIITIIGNGNGTNPMNYASSNTTMLAQEGDGTSFWTSGISQTVVASTSSFSPSFTSAAATDHILITATFKESAGGGGGTQPPRSEHYKRLMGRAANDDQFLLRASR